MKLISLILITLGFVSFAQAEVYCEAYLVEGNGRVETTQLVPAGPGYGNYGATIRDFVYSIQVDKNFLAGKITKGANEAIAAGQLSDTLRGHLQLVVGGVNTSIICNRNRN